MSISKVNFTPEQEAVIKHRGGAMLVSAAAGSGKTKTLVERLLDRISKGDSIDEFLVITYTRAAASELRERIVDEIHRRLSNDPENRNLRRQALLCRCASIDTIHGFCTDILRENAHIAGLPADFRVTDDSESAMIKAEVLKDILEKAYETANISGDFRELIDMMAGGRDDRRVGDTILDAHARLLSNPDPGAWVSEQISQLPMSGVSDVSETAWGRHLMDRARRTVRFWSGEMEKLREEIREYLPFEEAYGESVEVSISGVSSFSAALDEGWDEARRCRKIEFPRPKPISGYDRFKETRKRCKTAMEKCAAVFECSSDEHIEDMQAVAPAVTALLNLITDFGRAYSEEKRRRGIVDFSDLEHLALSLLFDVKTGQKTELARSVSKRFKEIMVDEYQDVNAVQEYIFSAVSRDGRNVFMVGDVKQSIYRFRLADPSIFLKKYRDFKEFSDSGDTTSDVKIFLSKNFRSRAGILNAVNLVFGSIMSEEFGEMEYTRREQLVPGREEEGDAVYEEPAVEFDIIDTSGLEHDEDEESPGKRQMEARFIAGRIMELISGGYMIPDGFGGSRRIEYSDVVILLRSLRDKAWQYAAALTEYGIPVGLPGGEGYFETLEVSAALSVLSVIDNPMQDIPLAAALRGPVYGFTADELAEIRAGSPGTDYYTALKKAAETGEKYAAFLEETAGMRDVAPDMPVSRFIWHMYNTTGLLGRVGALRGGDKRRNNLIALAEYARMYEQNGYKGLFGFLKYVQGLRERGWEPAQTASGPASDCVRIMSVHKSKGLEFPVVFLADTSKRFNYNDTLQPLVIHTELGVGAMRRDKQRRIEYTTLARSAVRSKLASEMLAEEMRVLYVAMTRAREKLIITAAFSDAAKEIGKLSWLTSGKMAPQALEDIKNTAGWILASLLNTQGYGQWTTGNGPLAIGDGQIIDFRVHKVVRPPNAFKEQTQYSAFKTAHSEKHTANPADVRTLRERFSFEYPFPLAPDMPSKLTVTGMKGRESDNEVMNEAAFYIKGQKNAIRGLLTERLADLETAAEYSHEKTRGSAKKTESAKLKGGLTAAARGTALHLAMQYIDFQKCGSAGGVGDELERLRLMGLLSEEQYEVIEARKITRFLESETGKRVMNADKVRREFKFSLLYPAERFYPGGGKDEILFQGVVDCFFEEGGELTVVDFKTDRVTQDTLEEKAQEYKQQLDAYSDALERITGKRVKQRIIYFFAPEQSYIF